MRDLRKKPSFIMLELNMDAPRYIETDLLKKRGLKVLSGQGSYKGTVSNSHLVLFKTLEDLKSILSIAREYNQESILIVDAKRSCELVFTDPNSGPIDLGQWVEVSKHEALKHDAWTFLDERYFVCG